MATNKSIKITFLGTAANGGIPQVDCRCQNCQAGVSIRNRSSLLLEYGSKKFVVDSGPDFRASLLKNNLRLTDLDGILLSHLHWDHCFGLVELSSGRALKVPIVVPLVIQKQLMRNANFKYLFEYQFAAFKESAAVGIDLDFVKIPHDPRFPTYALVIKVGSKTILIATDIAKIPSKLLPILKKADLVIFDGTFLNRSTFTHLAIKESVLILNKICQRVIFTHLNHSEDVSLIKNFLSKYGYFLAEDQMSIRISDMG